MLLTCHPITLPAPAQASEVAKLGRTPVLGLYGTRDTQFPAAMLDKFQVGTLPCCAMRLCPRAMPDLPEHTEYFATSLPDSMKLAIRVDRRRSTFLPRCSISACCHTSALQADLNAAGVPNRLERFEGEGHAFIKEAKSVEVGGAAGRAWSLFCAFVQDVAAGRPVSGPK